MKFKRCHSCDYTLTHRNIKRCIECEEYICDTCIMYGYCPDCHSHIAQQRMAARFEPDFDAMAKAKILDDELQMQATLSKLYPKTEVVIASEER